MAGEMFKLDRSLYVYSLVRVEQQVSVTTEA